MGETDIKSEESNVCVAVKIRPLVASELDDGCRESLAVTAGRQVTTGQHTFTYDHVFGASGTAADLLYPRCIAPLVDGLFKGYNATVFAYGQTGSGKTFTMGSEYRPGGRCRGVIPDVINDIFTRIEAAKDCAITVRVSFVEIHKEEVKDLLVPANNGPRPAVTIRETQSGDVALYGAVEKEVRTRQEMADVLELGTLCRSTASTQMNNRSSRSHAIFTITIEQRRQVLQQQASGGAATADGAEEDGEEDEDNQAGDDGEGLEDFLGAKMHLVDLAGSERAKRTKAEGARLREGIHINRGLLALGNVINAIVDNHKHVPYRDSKLTRLLQDSLGGNSRTVMIACVSPADSNFEESLNTLRYADRARHIRNKPVVNRDPMAAQLAALRNTIAQLKSENMALRRTLTASGADVGRDGIGNVENSAFEGLVERLTQENASLESENIRLKLEMEDMRRDLAEISDKWHLAQAQCDVLRMNQAAAAIQLRRKSGLGASGATEGGDGEPVPLPGLDIVKGYVARIAELEAEVKSMKSLAAHMTFTTKRRVPSGEPPRTPGASILSDLDSPSPDPSPMLGDSGAMDNCDGDDEATGDPQQELAAEEEFYMELAARTIDQEKMKKEVAALQRQLEAKEQRLVKLMKDASSMPALKQHYDRVLADLETQRDKLMAERKALAEKLAAASAASEEERKRLEATYKERLAQYDERIRELKRKEKEYVAMAKLKQRTEEVHIRLTADIARLKQQKVAMQRQLDQHNKQFHAWRQEREREVSQLRKQGRKDRATIQHLQAMQAKQNAVLQRKISEGNAARKRLKELIETKHHRKVGQASAASQEQAAAAAAAQQALGGNVEMQPNMQAPLLRNDKERREWLLKELELCNMSCEFRKVIDGELAQRAEATRKLKELEKRLTLLEQLQPASPLFMANGGASMVPISPSVAAAAASALGSNMPVGPEARAKLLAKKKELEDKVAHHNFQIAELQAEWERQKTEEEQRGGGAMDPRRWAGLRNVVECRELLRTLFRIVAESKSLSNDLTVDLVRVSEEVDVLRVQLDGAQKKSAQYRKLAMACQAAAARVVSAPHHSSMSTQDETDKQVDAVLEELFVVRSKTPPASTRNSVADEQTPQGMAAAVAEAIAPVSVCMEDAAAVVADAADVDMMDMDTPGKGDMAPKALQFLSPVPSGAHARMLPAEAQAAVPSDGVTQRYSPERDEASDDEASELVGLRAEHRRQVHRERAFVISDDSSDFEVSNDDEDSEDEESESESSEDEEDGNGQDSGDGSTSDEDWVPEAATPAPPVYANRRKSCHPSKELRPISLEAEEEDVLTDTIKPGKSRKSRGSSRRSSIAMRSTSSNPDDVETERHVLNAINVDRDLKGLPRVTKLTIAALKDALTGQVIDGQRWTKRNKTRAALIQDYRRLLGTDGGAHNPLDSAREGSFGSAAAGPADDARQHLNQNRSEVLAEPSRGTAVRPQPLEPVESPVAGPPDAEGFTFSPHVPRPGLINETSTAVVPPVSAAHPPSPPAPTPTGSSRRLNAGVSLGPWARSSLNVGHSSRQFTTWASSLRAPGAMAEGVLVDHGSSGAPHLVRSNSNASNSSLSRGNGAGGSGSADGSGGPAGRRPLACGSPSNGALRESAVYRGPLTSPRQSASPRLPGQGMQTATGATSPRSSLGSPTLHGPPRSSSKSPVGSTQSPGGSRDRGYDGGENMMPGCATPTATTTGVSGAGKVTPLAVMWQEKAAASRERTSALRASMQRSWEQHDPQQARAGAGGNTARASISSFASGSTSGSILSAVEGSKGGGLRDSFGAGQVVKQKAIWR